MLGILLHSSGAKVLGTMARRVARSKLFQLISAERLGWVGYALVGESAVK